MKVAFAGSTGFIGRRAAAALEARGDEVLPLGRDLDAWAGSIDGADAVVDLAGENVAGGRWTAARKQALRESRLSTTRAAVDAIARAARKPRVLVNASAVGWYGDAGEAELDESGPLGQGFLAALCRDWEAEARRAEASGARVVLLRFGVVLGPGGGALPRMALPFKLFAGGPLGSGRQWVPWVHLDDAVAAVLAALSDPALSGPVNVVVPEPVRNADFSKALGRALHRPAFMPAPAFALRLALGEMAGMLLGGAKVRPGKLQAAGFRFSHPSLDGALSACFK
jgi:uncharacterized protein (TIGR01777 family)